MVTQNGSRKPQVLLVDDDPIIFRLFQRVFRAPAGFNFSVDLLWYDNGDDAVDELSSLDNVVLVLCDVELPRGMDSEVVVKSIRAQLPDCPICLLTGHARVEWAGGIPVYTKPLSPDKIIEVISQYTG